MGSTPPARTVRDAVQTALQTIDGASTITLGPDSWTFNYDLSAATFLGGDPRMGTEDAAAFISLDHIRIETGEPIGYLTSRLAIRIHARAKPASNTAEERQNAALRLAGDITAALANDRDLGGSSIDIFTLEDGFVIETRDGDGLFEWTAGNGFVDVLIQPFWCGRLG